MYISDAYWCGRPCRLYKGHARLEVVHLYDQSGNRVSVDQQENSILNQSSNRVSISVPLQRFLDQLGNRVFKTNELAELSIGTAQPRKLFDFTFL